MEMRGAAQIIQVEMRHLQIQGRAEIAQDVTISGERKDYGDASGLSTEDLHAMHVNAGLRQALDAELAKGILSDARSESDAASQQRKVVSENRRGAAEGHGEIVGEVLAFGLERGRQAVQNQVGIQFPDDADVEALHSAISFF